MAEFNPDDSTLKWYNVLSSKFMPTFEPLDMPSTSATAVAPGSAPAVHCTSTGNTTAPSPAHHPVNANNKEESSDESTITSSQTSTLTRNQAPPFEMQAQIAEDVRENLEINDDEEEEDDGEEEDDDEEEEDEEELEGAVGMSNGK